MTPLSKSAQHGTVLIVVSGIIAALGLLAFTFLIIMAGRAREARVLLDSNVAREASKTALEYCYSAVYIGLYANYQEYRVYQGYSVQDAVENLNNRIFAEAEYANLYHLVDRGDFAHDALDLTPDPRAPVSAYEWDGTSFEYQQPPPEIKPVDIEKLERTLEPVAACYNCEIEGKFDPTTLSEPSELSLDKYSLIEGECHTYIKLFGWGRVFQRLEPNGFMPKAEDLMYARIKISIKGYVKLLSTDEPQLKEYWIWPIVSGYTDKRRITFDDPNFPKGWKGKTWFMQ
ncbi:MAG: hypothetical protein Kow00107_07370 [Planctomycetota bacterium]